MSDRPKLIARDVELDGLHWHYVYDCGDYLGYRRRVRFRDVDTWELLDGEGYITHRVRETSPTDTDSTQ